MLILAFAARGRRTCCLLALLAYATSGCGSSAAPTQDATTDGAATDSASGDGGPAHPSPEQWASLCTDYVSLYCETSNRCYSFYARQVWGEQTGAGGSPAAEAACAAHYQPRCLALHDAPGVTDAVMQALIAYTAQWKAGGRWTCPAAFDLESSFAWPVRSTPGALAAGAPCFDTVQCGANLRCSADGRCGMCVTAVPEGGTCSSDDECALPDAPTDPLLLCRDGRCGRGGGVGDTCQFDEQCQRLLNCRGGTCVRTGVLGDTCGDVLRCEAEHNVLDCVDGTCVARSAFPSVDGARCNFEYVGGGICSGSSMCLEHPVSADGHPAVTTTNGPTTSHLGITGVLLDGGGCNAAVADAAGKIVLCQRGGMGFEQKAANAPGAVAVVVYNTPSDTFPDTINAGAAVVPVLLVEAASGAALLAKVGSSVTVFGRDNGICRAPATNGQACGPDTANCESALDCINGTCRPLGYVCE